MKKISVKTIVAIGIGAALFFVLGRISIPSPVPNTNVTLQYGLLAFMSVVFGPLAGALIGLIGHALIDFSAGWGIWWSWVITSGVFGLLVGLAADKLKLNGPVPIPTKNFNPGGEVTMALDATRLYDEAVFQVPCAETIA